MRNFLCCSLIYTLNLSMAFRARRLGEIFRVLPQHLCSGISNQQSRGIFPTLFANPLPSLGMKGNDIFMERCFCVRRFSAASGVPVELTPEVDFLTFVKSTLDQIEGPYHCWLNKGEESKESLKDGVFLVLVGSFLEDSFILDCEHMAMIERVKLLQHRFPKLRVFGFYCGSSVYSIGTTRISRTIMKEYITFPILLSNKDFTEMTNAPCYLLFEGFRSHLHYYLKDVELRVIAKAIEEFNMLQNGNTAIVQNSKLTRMRQAEVVKEPYLSFKNLLLYFPGCISVDEDDKRLFLSDTNHHRIIIIDANGKILDSIGSSPGFEDGEFEIAKLLRPASSMYHSAEGCLYFVDSENHAIRRADMEKRTVETVYPICDTDRKVGSFWSWIVDKLGMGRKVDLEPEEFVMDSFTFPWHLVRLEENNLLITNSSFTTLWIMSAATGEIKETVKGLPNVMEICGHMIMEKISLLKEVCGDLLQQKTDANSLEGLPYAKLISSLATSENNIIFCDTAGQRVLKYNRGSREVSHLQFSNFGVLGLPYWLACPVERVLVSRNIYWGSKNGQIQHFNVQPGRCNIQVNIDIPEGTKLAAPLQEGCIWRQARGSAVELSGSEGADTSKAQVGVAQQWYEELDNLAFSTPVLESNAASGKKSDGNLQEDRKAHIDCAVHTSPGTSEVVIYAVFYLKLDESKSSCGDQDIKNAEKILGISMLEENRKQGTACAHLLLETCRDLRDVVFMKYLNLRIYLECGDHPSQNFKEVISTESAIDVHVSLD